ncbi:uncharacterized protein LOC123310343 [Coccinella septempunctata]|uniref:uncharacterized protein LOC123310343 n=1 Tax=Coccinella septempunctata TaxID=41139 RepID=UPI001D05E1A7|nr:uncharacterized protein LOC123310343 [Coccinella septempunctata]
MANYLQMSCTTYRTGPQVGVQSHTLKWVCLVESGGGRSSFKQKRKHKTLKLFIATVNVRTLKSQERLEELEEELTQINWDILGLSETRLLEEKCTILHSRHMFFQNNKDTNPHIGGIGILVNKRIKHLVTKIIAISDRVIYIVVQISEGYTLQVIQIYAPISNSR